MASANSIQAGNAVVTISLADQLSAGLARAETDLKAFAADIRSIGIQTAALGGAMLAPFIASVKVAGDAQESLSRFGQVFGSLTDEASEFADALAGAVGRSSLDVKDALGTFQSFFVGLGFGREQALDFSKTMEALAIDFASFNNLSDAEGMQRFISALSGSSEVLDRFGVNIKQAALEEELLAMGVSKSWQQVTEQEKAVARLSVIMRAMTQQGAVGDAVRTGDSWTNQLKRAGGAIKDIAAAIGGALVPHLAKALAEVNAHISLVADWIRNNEQLVLIAAGVATGVFGVGVALTSLAGVITAAGVAAGGFASLLTVAGAVMTALATPAMAALAAVAGLGAGIIYYTGAGGKALDWLMERFGELSAFAKDVFAGIADAVATGDLTLATEVLWAGLQVAWEAGTARLREIWESIWVPIQQAAIKAWAGVQEGWILVQDWFETNFPDFTASIAKGWANLTGDLRSVWATFQNWLSDRWLELMGLFDDTLDVDLAKQLGAEDLADQLAEIEQKRQAAVAEAERRRTRTPEQREQEKQERLAAVERQTQKSLADAQSKSGERVAASQQELKAAQERLDNARTIARVNRLTIDQARREHGGGSGAELPELDFAGIGDGMQQAKTSFASIGAFGGARASQLIVGGEKSRIETLLANLIDAVQENTRETKPPEGA